MTVGIVFLIIFLLSFKIEFRQYKNVYFLAIIFMSVLISIFVNLIIPSFELNMNVNYILILNMFYGVLVIVVMLLSLLNTEKKIANEGKFVNNMLVLGYGVFILINFLIISFKPGSILKFYDGVWIVYVSLIFYYLNIIFIFQNLYAWIISGLSRKRKSHFIIVLGAGIIEDKVTPLLQARLDKAIKIKKKNLDAVFIVSGGQGPDEIVSEAEAMRKYLLSQGVSNKDIIMEEKSTNTKENLIYSYDIMKKYEVNPFAIIVSNYFHILRAGFLSKQLKIDATVSGGVSKTYFYPNTYVREFMALLVMFKKTHIIAFLLITAYVISYVLIQ